MATTAKPAKPKKKVTATSASRKSPVARGQSGKAKAGRAPTSEQAANRLVNRKGFWNSLTALQREALLRVGEPEVSGGRGPRARR